MTHTQKLIQLILNKTGWSQTRLAEVAEVSDSQVMRWRGTQNMGFTAAIELCNKCGLSLADLLKEMSTSKECQRLTNQQKELTSKEETK